MAEPSPYLPPKRRAEIVITKHHMELRCCGCRMEFGHLTCSRCSAVRYCSELRRRMQWPSHKQVCGEIKSARDKAITPGVALSESFGGEDILRKTPLFTRGLFEHIDIFGYQYAQIRDPPTVPKNIEEEYFLNREHLVDKYVKCGW